MPPRWHALAIRIASAACAVAVVGGCGSSDSAPPPAERLSVRVHATVPHDPTSFTEGLAWENGRLYESSGLAGSSDLRIVDPTSGAVTQRRRLPANLFAEGIALDGERLIQLTWTNGVALEYRADDLRQTGTYPLSGEGWGLCRNADGWVMSDGSSRLTIRDRTTFAPVRTVEVTLDGRQINQLNELECVGTQVYANVWKTDDILRIDLPSGRVSAVVDASGLPVTRPANADGVLNGIAYLPQRRRFLITGKWWPAMFEVTFEPRGR